MKIDRKKLEALATIRVYCLPEDVPVRGNALASGDDALDEACEDAILADLENGNQWAWCFVEVRASYAGVDGADYLGTCSCASEADFRADVYFDDMRESALDQLARELELAGEALESIAQVSIETAGESAVPLCQAIHPDTGNPCGAEIETRYEACSDCGAETGELAAD